MSNWVRAMFDADEAFAWPTDGSTERLAVVGWWCDRGGDSDAPGHLVATPERAGNVPLLVPAECADEVRALLLKYAAEDD